MNNEPSLLSLATVSVIGVGLLIYTARVARKNGLNSIQRLRRIVNALGAGFVVVGMFLAIEVEPSLFTSNALLVAVVLWALAATVVALLQWRQTSQAKRRDAAMGTPPEPAPIDWTSVLMAWFLWCFVLVIPVVLPVVFYVALTNPGGLDGGTFGLSPIVWAAYGAAIVIAGVVAVGRKIRRDDAIRQYNALCQGIASQQSFHYDRGYTAGQRDAKSQGPTQA